MGIDINKIIAEATQEETDSSNEVLNETATAQIEETVADEKEQPTIIEGETPQMDTNHCMASAISAGLGAMTFRNHLRSLTEISDKAKSRWKTAGKVGLGVGAAAAAGGAIYNHMKGNEELGKVKANLASDNGIKNSGAAAPKAVVGNAMHPTQPNPGRFAGSGTGGEMKGGQGVDASDKTKSMAAKLNKAHQGNPLNTQNKAIH